MHEIGHEFEPNKNRTPPPPTECVAGNKGHDSQNAWCNSNSKCGDGPEDEHCVMWGTELFIHRVDGISLFDCFNLFGDPGCTGCGEAIRLTLDPI